MSAPQPWQSTVTVVATHPDPQAKVLWQHARDGFAFVFTTEGDLWFPDIAPIRDHVRAQWGGDCIVLRVIKLQVTRAERLVEMIVLVQLLTTTPGDGRWVPIADIDVGALEERQQRAVTAALPDISGEPKGILLDWMRRGWFDDAVAWATSRLHEHGIELNVPPVQERTWGLSTVIRFDTTAGAVYFKAAVHGGRFFFANEAALVESLSVRFPRHIVRPLAIDTDRVWMLLRDAGAFLYTFPDFAVWQSALRTHIAHQRDFMGCEEELLRIGCIDRRIELLPGHLAEMVEDGTILSYLEREQREQFVAAVPVLERMVEELASLSVPPTLVHGDFHSGNIAVRDGVPVVFDWTDSCLSQPWFDLTVLLADHGLGQFPDGQARLTAVWRDAWRDIVSERAIDRILALMIPVGALFQAVSYARLAVGLDDASRDIFGPGGASWLRRILAALA